MATYQLTVELKTLMSNLINRGDSKQPLVNEPHLPHGTEVRFDCVKGQRSWKIVCHNGRWMGLSLGCDENGEMSSPVFNGSCTFSGPAAGSHLVAFYDVLEVKGHESNVYEPGAELVFRCVDIGKSF